MSRVEVWNLNQASGRYEHADHGRMAYSVTEALGLVDWQQSPIYIRMIGRGGRATRNLQICAGDELSGAEIIARERTAHEVIVLRDVLIRIQQRRLTSKHDPTSDYRTGLIDGMERAESIVESMLDELQRLPPSGETR